MRLRDMKHIGFIHQRESKQNSDNHDYRLRYINNYSELLLHNKQFKYPAQLNHL